ncbi:MAG: HAMP domain-containing sensor histidine kinase [Candidatus Margulisiibacteriota bacterium]
MKKGRYFERNQEFFVIAQHLDVIVRKLLIPLFFVIALASYLYGIAYPILALALIVLIFFIVSGAVFWVIKRGVFPAEPCYFVLLLIDCVFLAFATYYTGGAESFVPLVYIVVGVLGGLTLPLWGVVGVIVSVGVCYFVELLLEMNSLLPSLGLFGIFIKEAYLSPYFRIVPLAYFVGFVAITFLSYQVAEILRKRRDRLLVLNRELNINSQLLKNNEVELKMANSELDKKLSELQKLKANLELLVEQRTKDLTDKVAALDQSHDAMLHIMQDLRRSDKIKDEFLSVVSHELRTPLTPLIDYLSLLKEGYTGKLNQKQKNIVERMMVSATRELNMIDALLNVSRLETGVYLPKKIPVSVRKVVADVVNELKSLIDMKQIVLEQQNLDITIMSDESLLVRAISQLLENALKFTPTGGKIWIRSETVDNFIKLEVEDTGIGVEKNKLEKIFDKFFQVDSSAVRQYGGMGLGLTIVRQIVKAHGGKIFAESPGPGKGTRIVVFLPISMSK